jgi:hypothetical protein
MPNSVTAAYRGITGTPTFATNGVVDISVTEKYTIEDWRTYLDKLLNHKEL